MASLEVNSHFLWIGFNLFILCLLALDLGVFHRKSHAVSFKEAITWSAVWISLSLLFNLGIYFWRGNEVAVQFLTGYLIEKALSVDNIFVFITIFSSFKINAKHQHRILFWGILGALVMRGLFIWAGVELLRTFHSVIYVFGAFLIFTGIRMALPKKEVGSVKSKEVQFVKKWLHVTDSDTGRMFERQKGRLRPTQLFLALVVIEITDLIFALDSIPAVLAITPDPFIVYSSNVFAILGLRSLYFAVSGAAQRVLYLHYGLAAILIFVGLKMSLGEWVHISTLASLLTVFSILAVSIGVSLGVTQSRNKRLKPS